MLLEGIFKKIGGGIFLCTPKNVNVEGTISEDEEKGKKKKRSRFRMVIK